MQEFRDALDSSPPDDHGKKDKSTSLLCLKELIAMRMLNSCGFCERKCRADRLEHEVGSCGVNAVSHYSSEFLHIGEEPELVPSHTIFFSGCTFKCVYCQNWDISTNPNAGISVMPAELSECIVRRHLEGARNVNLVGGDPTPHLHTILKVLGLCDINTPIVWNSNMYMSGETMKLLDGIVDVYLGDFKYGNDKCASRCSAADRYWGTITRNFIHAHEDSEILMRHLVLPGHLECCTEPIVRWASEHMPDVRFNLMFQYRPCHSAHRYPELGRSLSREEISGSIGIVKKYGLSNLANTKYSLDS